MGNLISVVINTCNSKNYMINCIENIINQTYRNLEILVINDDKDDSVLKMCSKYNDKRLKILNQNNVTLSKIIKLGLDNTSGDYLYFVDGHDFVDNDIIEKLYQLCLDYNVKMSLCESANIYNYNYSKNDINEKIDIITGYEMLNKEVLYNKNVDICNKLISKSVLESNMNTTKIEKIVLNMDRIAYYNQKKYFYCRENKGV